jgi:hypothetical protein
MPIIVVVLELTVGIRCKCNELYKLEIDFLVYSYFH